MGYRHFGYLKNERINDDWGRELLIRSRQFVVLQHTRLDGSKAKRALIGEVGVEHQMGFAFIFILFCEIHWEIDLVSISFPLLGPPLQNIYLPGTLTYLLGTYGI